MAVDMAVTCRSSDAWEPQRIAEAQNKEKGDGDMHARPKKSRKRREDQGLCAAVCAWICEHQLGISLHLLAALLLTHALFPRARRRTALFLRLSYHNPVTGQYGCGTDDLSYVALWLVVFTGLRVAAMEYVLAPLARLGGIRTRKGLVRFQEQAWLVCYCTCSWSLGMYILYHSPAWFSFHGMWRGWPFFEISGLSKFYYLAQWAFWVQQIVVVNVEEKRKDYAQMLTHHVFTSALLFLSYGYYHTRVGIVILCLMDLVDIVLPTAKLLKYMGYTSICDYMFGLFVLAWVVTRQVFYPMVIYSVYAHSPLDMEPGCYFPSAASSASSSAPPGTLSSSDSSHPRFIPSTSPLYAPHGGNDIWRNLVAAYNTDRSAPVCWNPTIRYSFLALLLALQAIILMWFVMIVRVVWKVVSGCGAEDVRSDDEDEDEDEEVGEEDESARVNGTAKGQPLQLIEREVGVESLTFTSSKSKSKGKSGSVGVGVGVGVGVPRHRHVHHVAAGVSKGDRKELLGRIGCDKPT